MDLRVIREIGGSIFVLLVGGEEELEVFAGEGARIALEGVEVHRYEIPVEVWDLGKVYGGVLLEPQGRDFVAHSFTDLRERVQPRAMEIVPSAAVCAPPPDSHCVYTDLLLRT